MTLLRRIVRHSRLSLQALSHRRRRTPPFMIVFINSICNLTCEHCFYWRNLNKRDDLVFDEFKRLSEELGTFENLNLSGGEPFLHPQFADVCSLFIRNNGVKQIYVPSNGYYREKMKTQLTKVLENKSLEFFVCELSLDGMPEYHDKFRGNPHSFRKAMESIQILAACGCVSGRKAYFFNTFATMLSHSVWSAPSKANSMAPALLRLEEINSWK